MTPETIALLIVNLLGFTLVATLLLRRSPGDAAALLRLQQGLDAQSQRLAALPLEIRADMVERTGDVATRLSDQLIAQTRALSGSLAEAARQQNEAALATQRVVADGAAHAAKALAEHCTSQGDAAVSLRRDLATGTADLKALVEAGEAKTRKALADDMTTARDLIERKALEGREESGARLKEMREANDARLADIQRSVNEQLHSAVEKQMAESFNRVIDQFAAVQKAMGDVQAVTSQIGDLKRLFSNVKTRGGWGEAQVKSLLDDIMTESGYVMNLRAREGSAEVCEFGVLMPQLSGDNLYLPIDAKFPVEDYHRLLNAAETGDIEEERGARKALGERVRRQAGDIASKYICPPVTVEYAILYLPSDSLYAEVARLPGMIEDIHRTHRVLILGPSLLPAMLNSIKLGHVSLSLNRNAEAVRELLGATKAEVRKMDDVLDKLSRQAGTFGKTIGDARTRTRAIGRKLRSVSEVALERSSELLELEVEVETAEAE